MSVDVTITDKSEEFFRKVEATVEKFILQVLLKIQADAQQIIRDKKAYATLEMYRNIRYEIVREAMKIIGIVGGGANVPYTIFRHEGTRAHWPPQLAIQQWIIKKGFLKIGTKPTTLGGLRALYRRKDKTESNRVTSGIQNMAFLIARKISQKGTEGLPFLKMALNQNLGWIAAKLAEFKLA